MLKKLLMTLLLIAASHIAYADNQPILKIKVTGTTKDNKYFLCTSKLGCVSMLSGVEGRTYPMNTGNIDNLYMLNTNNLRVYAQTLPASCNINLQKNQTLTISGHIVKGKTNSNINKLKCSIT